MVSNGSSLEKAMKESGYSPAYARSHKISKTTKFKEELRPIIERLRKERDAALRAMKDKRNFAKYGELNTTVEGFTKLLQLLEGKPTEIQEIKDLSEAIKKLAEK